MSPIKKNDKLLLFGDTGKMGRAVLHAFGQAYDIEGMSSGQFDAENLSEVEGAIRAARPRIVVNAVALGGIDACENEPERALRINALFPKRLAELSVEYDFSLLHFSSDAVLGDTLDRHPVESDAVDPFNVYALTKYGGDCFVASIASGAYVFRLPMLFGESTKQDQFVEKMLARVRSGAHRLRVSSDVIGSPSYSRDIAKEMRRIFESELPPGLYHLTNAGQASLHDLTSLLVDHLGLGVKIDAVSHREFPSLGRKNVYTTMCSEKVSPLRPWRQAFREYCENIRFAEPKGVEKRKKWSANSQTPSTSL